MNVFVAVGGLIRNHFGWMDGYSHHIIDKELQHLLQNVYWEYWGYWCSKIAEMTQGSEEWCLMSCGLFFVKKIQTNNTMSLVGFILWLVSTETSNIANKAVSNSQFTHTHVYCSSFISDGTKQHKTWQGGHTETEHWGLDCTTVCLMTAFWPSVSWLSSTSTQAIKMLLLP